MDDRIDYAARERAYRLYSEQEAWMLQCGGDREGYHRVYQKFGESADPDAIYEADLGVLQELLDEYRGTSEYDKALRVLGEDYFA